VNIAVLHPSHIRFAVSSCRRGIHAGMSYNLTVQCGCLIYVSCDPKTGYAHSRVIERKGEQCRVRTHDVGVRLYLWELLPEPAKSAATPPTNRFDTA
jgi:hypothetical protein